MALEFVSERGRVYDANTIVPVVLALLDTRFRGVRKPDWRSRVRSAMTPDWLQFRNGCTPGALARDLELEML